jgi:hypothetical protein
VNTNDGESSHKKDNFIVRELTHWKSFAPVLFCSTAHRNIRSSSMLLYGIANEKEVSEVLRRKIMQQF